MVFYSYRIQYRFVLRDNLSKPRSIIGPVLNLIVLKLRTSKHINDCRIRFDNDALKYCYNLKYGEFDSQFFKLNIRRFRESDRFFIGPAVTHV